MANDFPARSLLFMPGHKARPHEKARELDADGVIFDWEDAVAPADKAAARQQTTTSIRDFAPWRCAVLVRINHPSAPEFEEDVAAVTPLIREELVQGVVVPKITASPDLGRVAKGFKESGLPATPPLWANIETPEAVLNLHDIAANSPNLVGLIAGINDLSAALQLPFGGKEWHPRLGLYYTLSQLVLMARIYGKIAIDGVYNRIDDLDGLAEECVEGRHLGFDGKSLIHPSHLATANLLFKPSDAELQAARELVTAYEQTDGGAVRHSGTMVEELHVASAKRLLAVAEKITART